MTNQRAGAVALVAGSALYLMIVALHPTRGTGPEVAHGVSLGEIVHGIAILGGPLFIFGALILAMRQGLDRWPVLLGLTFYVVGAVIGLLAPAISGLVAPQIIEEMAHAPAADRAAVHGLGHLAYWLNQAFGRVHYALTAVALLTWSAAWRGPGAGLLRAWGLLAGAGLLAWQALGAGHVDVHVLGALLLVLGGWHVLAAVWLWRDRA